MEDKNKVPIKDLLVTQSNTLVEATYPRSYIKQDGAETDLDLKVSTRAHKVSRLIVSLISPNDGDLRCYKIGLSTLKNYLGYKVDFPNGKFYQDLRDIANRLNKQPIEIHPEPKRIITAYFISAYELNFETGEITFEISSLLKPFLIQLKNNFTSFHLENIPKLSSGYSIRLYEVLYQYRLIGKRTFDNIDKLQQMLGSSYGKYSHFKARVLEFAKKDISNNTNISFDYKEIKTGKKVTKLVFYIKENTPTSAIVVEDDLLLNPPSQYLPVSVPILPDFYEEIAQIAVKEWKVNEPVLKKLVAEFPAERLRQAVETTKYAIERGKIKGKVAGFFVEAVRVGYTVAPEPLAKNLKKTKEVMLPINETPTESIEKSLNDQKKQAYEIERIRILTHLEKDTDLRDRILEHIQGGMFKDFYNPKLSFDSNLEKPAFYGLVAMIFKRLT